MGRSNGTIIVIVMLSLLPGAYGISMDISASSGMASVGSSTNMNPPSDFRATDRVTLSLDGGVGLTESLSATALASKTSLNQSHVATNDEGYIAQARLKVTDADSYTYDYGVYPENPGDSATYVKAWESLSATNATEIQGQVYAANPEGDRAWADTYMANSSVENYVHIAKATSTSASAKVSWDYASGDCIFNGLSSWNAQGDNTQANIKVNKGYVSKYSGSASAGAGSSSVSQSTYKANGKMSGEESGVYLDNYAQNARFYQALTGASVDNGYIVRYKGSAAAKKNKASTSEALQGASVSKGNISMGVWGAKYYNKSFLSKNKDISAGFLDVTKGKLNRLYSNGRYLNGYEAEASTISEITSASQTRIRAKGDLTSVMTYAYSYKYDLGDSAGATLKKMGRMYTTAAKTNNDPDDPDVDAVLTKGTKY